MKGLNKEELLTWYQRKSIKITDNDFLYFGEDERHCIAVELPGKPSQLIAMAAYLLPYGESVPFQGALLWMRQWGVWSELVEQVGLRVVELIRYSSGETRPLEEAPGLLFDSQELVDLQVCLVQPLLVGWDAFLVPESGDYIVATSHDETTCVLSRTAEIHRTILEDLQPWNPREGCEWYFRGIGIPPRPS